MTKKYQEIPLNFKDIQNYLIYKQNEVVNAFFNSDVKKYFFYDTCSILHHSNSKKRQFIINYLVEKSATIIITRTVLMELTANSFKLHSIQVEYFKELYESGLKIFLMDEEIIFNCFKKYLNITIEDANKLLGFAVKEICKFKTKTKYIINQMTKNMSNKLLGINPGNTELFTDFFRFARSLKSHGDSLAEELIFICIIVLTRIPMGKYFFISDDLNVRYQVIIINKYIEKHHKMSVPIQITTASLLNKMYRDNFINNKEDMVEILKSAFKGNVSIFYVGEYDIEQKYKSFKCEEIIDRLLNEKDFRILY